jgi:hypothetical protein
MFGWLKAFASNVVGNVIHEYTADGKLLRTMGKRDVGAITNSSMGGRMCWWRRMAASLSPTAWRLLKNRITKYI